MKKKYVIIIIILIDIITFFFGFVSFNYKKSNSWKERFNGLNIIEW